MEAHKMALESLKVNGEKVSVNYAKRKWKSLRILYTWVADSDIKRGNDESRNRDKIVIRFLGGLSTEDR